MTLAGAVKLLRSTFGYRALKSFQAFLLALSAILLASSNLNHANPKRGRNSKI